MTDSKQYSEKISGYKELVFGYSSFISLLYTLIFTTYAVWIADWGIEYNSLLFLLALINASAAASAIYCIRIYHKLASRYSKLHGNFSREIKETKKEQLLLSSKLQQEKDEKEKVSEIFHNILHDSREISNEISSLNRDLFRHVLGGKNQKITRGVDDFVVDELGVKILGVENSFSSFILYALNNLKNLFDTLTGDKCFVCVKFLNILSDHRDDIKIKTYKRDSASHRKRSVIDEEIPEFPYYENTAFLHILDSKYKESFFLCNDLNRFRDNKESDRYRNARNDWEELYNACLVVPIRIKLNPGEYSVIGFICVDNMKGGFDSACADILSAVGDHFFLLFEDFNELKMSLKYIDETLSAIHGFGGSDQQITIDS